MSSRRVTALAKWGNSTGVRIPSKLAEEADLQAGDEVSLQVEGPGVIVLRASQARSNLETLVSRISRKNRHGETDWGNARGHEVW